MLKESKGEVMAHWQIFCIVGVISLILEMVIPSFFFLNFSVAGFLTAILTIWILKGTYLGVIFVFLTLLSLLLLRPFCLSKFKSTNTQTGVESTYFGKIAKVIEPVSRTSGTISIFDERWNARLIEGDDVIPVGSEVRIIKNDSLMMYVIKA